MRGALERRRWPHWLSVEDEVTEPGGLGPELGDEGAVVAVSGVVEGEPEGEKAATAPRPG
jgi:hypothetical protein